jgi:hypothetical protein
MSAARVSAFNPNTMRRQYLPEDDPYPTIRSVLAPEFAGLPAEDVESLLASNGIRAEDMEGFLDDVGHAFSSAAKAVAPIATKALPGIISGAATGCALGPWGCLGGALIGGVSSALSSGGGKPAGAGGGGAGGIVSGIASALPAIAGAVGGGGGSGAGGIVSGIASALPAIAGAVGGAGAGAGGGGVASGIPSALPAIAGLVGGSGQTGAPDGGKTNPAGVLLGLLQRPEMMQSLMSMALGPAGRKDVPVGGTSVPVAAFANLLSALGSKAFAQAEAWAEPSEDLPDYLYKNGTLAVDPAVPAQRAAVLLEMLGQAAARTPVAPRVSRPEFTEADEYYDALDMAELDFLEMEGNDEFDD